MTVSVNIAFLILSLLYMLFLNILFLNKEHIKSFEISIFGKLLGLNLLGIILELGCIFSIMYVDNAIWVKICNKAFLLYLLSFIFVFSFYVFNIAFKNIDKVVSALKKIIFILYCICVILIIFLKIEIYNFNGIIYSYGPSADIIFLASATCVAICLITMVKNYRNLKSKKYLPLFTFIIGGSIVTIIQKANPAITLATSMESFLLMLMYHTIENPDLKLVRQLEFAKDTADKANMAKSDFLSSMSHEIRTPLNAIVGFSNCIEEDETLQQAKEDAKDIVKASQNLLEIVNGVLDISKIEANKMEIINVNYNPNEVFNDLIKLVSTRIGEKDIKVRTSIAPDLPLNLYGDSGKIKEVVTNLLTNAVKYTEKGYVDFKVNCINENETSKIMISVSDTGRGIKPEKIDSLFTKFNRLEEDKNTSIEGTGLGLAITKSLVEMMGGKIVVQSKYQEGSNFTVYLNQKISNIVDKQQNIEENEILDLTGKKILLVDDNNMNLKIGTRMLIKYNLDVTQLDSGEKCLNQLETNNYDLILMDDMMPNMSGTETMKKIKSNKEFETPIVVLTANATNGMRENYLQAGFDDYLSKPINKIELEKILNRYL